MEADFTEVEVTHIPKAAHRTLVGPKGATAKQLRKEFKVEIEIPEEKSRHATIIVGGAAANVKKCIARMEALTTAGGEATAAAEPTVAAKTKKEGGGRDAKKNTSAGASAAAPIAVSPAVLAAAADAFAVSYPLTFEKSAHAKLRGPRDAKKHELEKALRAAVAAASSSSSLRQQPLYISLGFPPASDLTNSVVSVDAFFAGDAPRPSEAEAAALRAVLEGTTAQFLSNNKLGHHARGIDIPAPTAAAEPAPSAATPAMGSRSATAASEASAGGGSRRGARGGKKGGAKADAEVAATDASSTPAVESSAPKAAARSAPANAPRRAAANPFTGTNAPKGVAVGAPLPDPFALLGGLLTTNAPQRALFA